MKPKYILIPIAFLRLVLFLTITGCTDQPVQTPSQTIMVDTTFTSPPAMNSPKPSSTYTQLTIQDSTPLPTNTSTVVPSPTRLPLEQAEVIVSDLLKNNAGCLLPCWWGIVPGKTPWEEAQSQLIPITYDFIFIEPPGDFTKAPKSNSFIASFKFPVSEDIFPYYPDHNFTVQSGIVQSIETTPGNISEYNLSSILNTYGQPEEVWIRTYANPLDDSLPFGVVIFYPNQGIVASYYPRAQEHGGSIFACPQEAFISSLGLWRPDQTLLFDEAATKFKMDPDAWAFQRLSKVTVMDEERFFETFKDPTNTTCLETSAKYWSSLP